ncbi:Transmembrane protein 131-like [Strongyloides ratti]|uniref:Transmembrane protein 131-like n=1 Tax=Strongyloides ratti TaxID=34506 RepID=A0A090L668_STRRB|nr:Transmembrane protein 131-like [Strongyloides ratti]CEF65202.1 Transmembrane protein 131-like [Strongyloides ratti]
MLILNVIKFKFCFLFTLLLTLSIFRLTTSVILTSRPTAVELAEGIDDVISHAFVQTGSELYYLSNDDDFSISLDEKKETTTSNLILDPEELDFGECYMGVPKVLTVKIYNPTDKTIHFKGISGNFAHFHSSFTTKKDLAPNEETTFDVIFLSRTERWVEDFIIIHLETGYLKLPVKGQGKKTPYRLKKQIVATVPMNSSFISPITIYNPHPKLLRITEIISSHNDVHLELPDSKTIKEISVDSWEIEPFTTKTLINAKILGAHEQNLLSYITLKTKLIDKDRKKFIKSKFSDTFENSVADNIIIPVDVKVEQKISIYSTTDLIDFGLIKAGMNSKDVKNIELFSTLSKSIDVQSVTFEGNNDFHNININFDPKNKVAISPSMDNKPGAPVKICKVQMITLPYINYLKRVHDLPAIAEVYMKGKIIVTFKHASFNVTIPYIATVYSGYVLLKNLKKNI